MAWTTADGNPVIDGWLIVRQRSKQIFVDGLSDCRGEIALTPSDAPYQFVLQKGPVEDVVLTMEDVPMTGTPVSLDSTLLGIKPVATAPCKRHEAATSTPPRPEG